MQFGDILQKLRREKGVTQEALAAELGVTAQAVSKWEKGHSLPDVLMLADIADFFGVSADVLLGRRGWVRRALAVIEDDALFRRTEEMAGRYGCRIVGRCASFAEAKEQAREADVSLILIGAAEADLAAQAAQLETEATDLPGVHVYQSVSASPEEIVNGLEWALKNMQ